MSKIQKQDVKTEAQLTGAGATAADLINDTQIYVSALSINKTLDDAIVDGDIGGGGASGNYITGSNSTAAATVGSWLTYADAAATQPVDGTGGSPNIVLSRTTVSGELLNGLATFEIAKTAANRQGEGAGLAFSIDNASKNKPMQIRFNYNSSANFDYGTPYDIADPSDITCYIYDVTNAVLIQPYPYFLDGSGKFVGSFQASSSASYRLILHVSTTNASAWDFYYDNVFVGEAVPSTLAADSDWFPYVPVFTGFGTVSALTAYYRKKGADLEIFYRVTQGTNTATEARVSFPVGLISASTIPSGANVCGNVTQDSPSAGATYQTMETSKSYVTFSMSTSGDSGTTKINGDSFSNGTTLSSLFKVPIQGWTSGFTTAETYLSNLPSVLVANKSAGSITAATKIGTWTNEPKDSLGAFDSSTGDFTVKVPGDYRVDFSLSVTVTSTSNAEIRKNGTIVYQSSAGVTSTRKQVSGVLANLVAGDVITVSSSASETVSTNTVETFLCIEKMDSPAAFMNIRKIATIKDEKSSGTNGGGTTAGSFVTRTLNTLTDPFGITSLSSNQFVLQPGTYRINVIAPAYGCGNHKAKLRNVTDSTDQIIGSSEFTSNVTQVVVTSSTISGSFTITAAKTFEIQHRSSATQASNGFGVANSMSVVEVYTTVEIEKLM